MELIGTVEVGSGGSGGGIAVRSGGGEVGVKVIVVEEVEKWRELGM